MALRERAGSLAPWFTLPERVEGDIAVIGAGIAGSALVHALVRRGAEVTLFDREGEAGQAASGNPRGVVMPAPASLTGEYGRFYMEAFRFTRHWLAALNEQSPRIEWHPHGAFWMGRQGEDEIRLRRLADELTGDERELEWLAAAEATKLAGIDIPTGALYYPHAGSVTPPALCRALLKGAEVRPVSAIVTTLCETAGGWELFDAQGQSLGWYAVVVLATGAQSGALEPGVAADLQQSRGQITLLDATRASRQLRCALCYEGYLLPVHEGGNLLGASYRPCSTAGEPTEAEHRHNLELLQTRLDVFSDWTLEQVFAGRSALRATTADRLPLVGPVPDWATYAHSYADLRHGRPESGYPPAPYRPGLYMLSGFGSRGLIAAPFMAERLAAWIQGDASHQDIAMMPMIHPARFLLRRLRRGKDA